MKLTTTEIEEGNSEIEEGNKLFAEYMGYSQGKELYGMVIDGKYYTYGLMGYHWDWNWLMPVYIKINNYISEKSTVDFKFGYESETDNIQLNLWYILEDINLTTKKLWLSCLELIKWYKQNENKEENR